MPRGGPRRRSPDELKVAWRTPIGSGYSGPAVADGRVFVSDWAEDPASRTLDGTERAIAPGGIPPYPAISRVVFLFARKHRLSGILPINSSPAIAMAGTVGRNRSLTSVDAPPLTALR